MATAPIKLAVLVSGSGTTLQNLIDVIQAGDLNAEIVTVVASRPDAYGLERAARAGLPHHVVDRKQIPDRKEFSRQVFTHCYDAQADLICLGGWLCLLDIPQPWDGRIMNIHPALLPSFGGQGMYGAKVHRAVIDHGCKVSGCTVHFVDQTYDNGPIIMQRTCPVLDDDTPETLAARVFEQECRAFPDAIRLFQDKRLQIEGRRVRVLPQKLQPAPAGRD